MKVVFKLAALGLFTLTGAKSPSAFAATAPAENLVRGVVGPVGSSGSWSGFSAVSKIPGAGLIPVPSTTTVFYLGFTAGARADINNIALYTTARGGTKITAVTPVKLGGVSNPSINLASASVCPVVEISVYNPCIVRLDPTSITLSALDDYYLVVYFTASDTNNGSLGVTQPVFSQASLTGAYQSGDDSRLKVGASIPSLSLGTAPYLLMYVMTD